MEIIEFPVVVIDSIKNEIVPEKTFH